MPGPVPVPDFVLRIHSTSVQAVVFHPSKGLVYSGDADGVLFVCDLVDRRSRHKQRLHPSSAGIIGLLWADDPLLISQGRDGQIAGWKLQENGAPESAPAWCWQGGYTFCKAAQLAWPCSSSGSSIERSSSPRHATPIMGLETSCSSQSSKCAAQAPTGMILAYPDANASNVLLRSVHEPSWQKCLRTADTLKFGMCMAVALFAAAACPHAACAYEDGTVAVWSSGAPETPVMHARLHNEPVMALVLFETADGGICGSADASLVVFHMDLSSRTLAVRHSIPVLAPGCSDLAVRQDHRIFAVAGWDGRVIVYHLRKRRVLAILQYHNELATCVKFQPSSGRIVTAAKDGTIAVWSVFTESTAS